MIKAISEHLPATINTGEWSMIYTDNDTPVKLFNILKDPKQITNVFSDKNEIALKLHKKYNGEISKLV